MPSDSGYLFGAEQYFAFEQAYASEYGQASLCQDEASRYYPGQIGMPRGFLNYNGLPHDEMAQIFASQAAGGMAQAQSHLMKPYQTYNVADQSIGRSFIGKVNQDGSNKDSPVQGSSSENQAESAQNPVALTSNKKEPVVADPDLKQI